MAFLTLLHNKCSHTDGFCWFKVCGSMQMHMGCGATSHTGASVSPCCTILARRAVVPWSIVPPLLAHAENATCFPHCCVFCVHSRFLSIRQGAHQGLSHESVIVDCCVEAQGDGGSEDARDAREFAARRYAVCRHHQDVANVRPSAIVGAPVCCGLCGLWIVLRSCVHCVWIAGSGTLTTPWWQSFVA